MVLEDEPVKTIRPKHALLVCDDLSRAGFAHRETVLIKVI